MHVNLIDSHNTNMPAAPAPKTRESKPREAKPREAKPKEAKPKEGKEAKEDKSKVHKLSLKGSSKLCVEFFEFAANTILFQRGVYPPEDFAP